MDFARCLRWGSWPRRGDGDPIPFPTTNVHGYRTSFPQLKSLVLERIFDCIAVDVLRTLDRTSLSHIAISVASFTSNVGLGDTCISASLLHEKYPSLQCISIQLRGNAATVQIIKDLASPGLNGEWLLPKLDTMVFTSISLSLLSVLTQVVTSRLRSNQTNSIRSIITHCSAGNHYVNSFDILAPHTIITLD